MEIKTIHPFERAGLGKAPFRFVSMTEAKFCAVPGGPILPGSTCDYCGTAIMYVFHLASADGQKFKVGCDCVEKVCHKGERVYTDVERAFKRQQKESADTRLKARVKAARETLEANPELLTDKPHPSPWFAAKGLTLRDSVRWFLDNAGASGKAQACRTIEKARG